MAILDAYNSFEKNNELLREFLIKLIKDLERQERDLKSIGVTLIDDITWSRTPHIRLWLKSSWFIIKTTFYYLEITCVEENIFHMRLYSETGRNMTIHKEFNVPLTEVEMEIVKACKFAKTH